MITPTEFILTVLISTILFYTVYNIKKILFFVITVVTILTYTKKKIDYEYYSNTNTY